MKDHIQLIRKLSNRLSDMIEVCEDETLKDRLSHLTKDLLYQAPEALSMWGVKVAVSLHACFGDNPPTDGWKAAVFNAWTAPRP